MMVATIVFNAKQENILEVVQHFALPVAMAIIKISLDKAPVNIVMLVNFCPMRQWMKHFTIP